MMAKPKTLCSSFDEDESVLQRYLLDQVATRLRNTLGLKFADVNAVIALCQRHLKYGKLSFDALSKKLGSMPAEPKAREDWLTRMVEQACEQVAMAGYVQDCERIAQYLHAQTPVKIRGQIRNYYWQEYTGWLEKVLKSILTNYHGKSEAEVRLTEGQNFVEDKVFREDSFREVAIDYKPRKGKTFEQFIKWRILRRCRDIAGRCVPPQSKPVGPDPIVPSLEGTNLLDRQDRARRLYDALRDCLDRLRQRAKGRKEDLGVWECAVFELFYKAYFSSAEMNLETLALIEKKKEEGSSLKIEDLDYEYHKASQKLEGLENKIQGARCRRYEGLEAVHDCERELKVFGYSASQIRHLSDQALQNNKGDMEKEQKATSSDKRLKELDYMLSYREYNSAVSELEGALKDYHKSLTRSQEDIAELIGISQPTVSRYLGPAIVFMQKCLRAKDAVNEFFGFLSINS